MVELKHEHISICEQCRLLSIHRSGLYYKPCVASDEDLRIMLEIDILHLRWPFYGARRLAKELQGMNYIVGKKRVKRLMRIMDLHVMYPKPRTSEKAEGHKIYPYLLRDLKIVRPNQVWETDITYIPMKKGFMYLIAIIDVYSRFVVGWSVSNSMEAKWCVEAAEEAIRQYGKPEIFNTDQGSQFTSDAFTGMLTGHDIKISMDGKGRALDNVFIERLWRNVKQEKIYINAYETGTELYHGLKNYFYDYNYLRIHQGLNYAKPCQVYNVAA